MPPSNWEHRHTRRHVASVGSIAACKPLRNFSRDSLSTFLSTRCLGLKAQMMLTPRLIPIHQPLNTSTITHDRHKLMGAVLPINLDVFMELPQHLPYSSLNTGYLGLQIMNQRSSAPVYFEPAVWITTQTSDTLATTLRNKQRYLSWNSVVKAMLDQLVLLSYNKGTIVVG